MKQAIVKSVKSIFGIIEYSLRPWNYREDELLVLCMHSTPFERRKQFEYLLDFLFKHFKPLQPNQLDHYFKGMMKEGPYVLFTFDDGLKNNLMAAELLELRNTRAVFFVVPDFIQAKNSEAYYRTNIRQNIDSTVDHEPEDFTAMTESDLKLLLSRGHSVESHTMSHLLRAASEKNDIAREVKQSRQWISQTLSTDCTMFCSPIQTNFSVSSQAKRLINEEYKFHFTTFPGLHADHQDAHLIFRRNIEVHWSLGQVKYALGKADLSRWKDEIAQFRQL